MKRIGTHPYEYIDPSNGGKQKFSIELFEDNEAIIGRGLSSSGGVITGDFRVAPKGVVELDHDEAVKLALQGVQGLILRVIESHRNEFVQTKVEKSTRIYTWSAIVAVIALIAGFASVIISPAVKPSQPSIQQRINELENIQRSLSQLGDYVKDRKEELGQLSETLENMKKKKQDFETVLALNETQVEALLRTQDARRARQVWIERGISFVIGFLASLLASYVFVILPIKRAAKEATRSNRPQEAV